MIANTLQSLGLKPPKGKTGKEAVVEEEEALPLGGAAARRRLLQVSQLAVRGLELTDAVNGYVLEVAAAGVPEPLEQSGEFETRNPTWVPVCGFRRGRHLRAFEVRAVEARSSRTLWSQAVDLQELEPFCEDLEELHHVPPRGVPLLRLGKQWFALPVWLASAGISSAVASAPEMRRRNAPVKHIKASEICSAGDRISVMIENLRKLETKTLALREAMDQSLSQGQAIYEQRRRRLASEDRVRQLREAVADRRRAVERLRSQLESERRGAAAGPPLHGGEWLGAVEERRREAAARLAEARGGLRSLWRQLRCRQLRMLHEVCQVYPIEKDENCWRIRGFCIVSIDNLMHQDLREEENVSTALGFLAHLLVTLAGILEVPLRISVQQAGCSRSYLSDPHESLDASAPPREFPLYYGRGLEKSRFETALRLLRDGLHQFLYSRGYFDERRPCGGNLLECAALIVRKEMYGAESPP